MNPFKWMVQKNSVAQQLLIRVLASYFGVALVFLAVGVTIQYNSVKKEVEEELRLIHESFGPGLAQALWDFNTDQVQSFFEGMSNLPSVVGVEIQDESGKTVCIGGTVLDESGAAVFIDAADHRTTKRGLGDVFSYTEKVTFGDDRQKVGEVTVYSSSDIVLQRLKLGVGLTLIQVCVAAAALCLIFVWFFRRLLGRPLMILTSAVEGFDPDHIEDFHVDVAAPGRNELKVLEESFNRMSDNLARDKAELVGYRNQLEEQVAERTGELERLTRLSEAKAADESSLAALTSQLQGKLKVEEVAEHALAVITEYIGAPSGALYVLDDDNLLHRAAAHALSPDAESLTSFAIGIGSVGQAARSRQLGVQAHPEGTNAITFGFGSASPPQIVTSPLVSSNELAGVVELLLFEAITEEQIRWLEKACEVAATSLRFAHESRSREEAG